MPPASSGNRGTARLTASARGLGAAVRPPAPHSRACRRVAHLDLKPHNLLLCRRPNRPSVLKVADFGFAVKFKALKGDGGLRGSPLYMAPEILMSKK